MLQAFPCGCAITSSRLTRQITSVAHCGRHWDLRTEDKTLKVMATELRSKLGRSEVDRLAMKLHAAGGGEGRSWKATRTSVRAFYRRLARVAIEAMAETA